MAENLPQSPYVLNMLASHNVRKQSKLHLFNNEYSEVNQLTL